MEIINNFEVIAETISYISTLNLSTSKTSISSQEWQSAKKQALTFLKQVREEVIANVNIMDIIMDERTRGYTFGTALAISELVIRLRRMTPNNSHNENLVARLRENL